MKLPTLGILTVIFLQLGFTAYNALDRPMESLAAVKAITTGTNPIAGTFNNPNDESFRSTERIKTTVSTLSARNYKRPAAMNLISGNKQITASRTANFRPQVVAYQKPFESVTITYPQPPPPPANAKSESIQYTARMTAKPEKRSFIAKSVSMIKKPYDWIKALGSRIN